MKVLFISPAVEMHLYSPGNPIGLMALATYLNARGHTAIIRDRAIKKENLDKLFDSFRPDAVGISLMSTLGIADSIVVSKAAKKHGVPVFWGGQQTTMMPEIIASSGYCDAVMLGEGEITFMELLDAIEKKQPFDNIAGLAFMKDGKFVTTPERKFTDISRFGLDWSLIRPEDYFISYYFCTKMIYMYGSKGCPFNCDFCFNHYYNKNCRRIRDFDIVLDEIEYLIKNHGLNGIYFVDDLIFGSSQQARESCAQIKARGMNFIWGGLSRVGQYSYDDYKIMYDAGCRWMVFGIESGSEYTLNRMNKKITMAEIEKTVADCRRAGIIIIGNFIIGFPGETVEELRKTTREAMKLDINLYSVNHFEMVIRSKICDEMIAEGKFSVPNKLEDYIGLKPTEMLNINFSQIPKKDLVTIRCFFLWISFASRNIVMDTKNYALAKRAISLTLREVSRYGFFKSIPRVFIAGKNFLYHMYHANFHRSILKKYDLSFKEKCKRNKAINRQDAQE